MPAKKTPPKPLSTVEVDYRAADKSFEAYPDFTFSHPARSRYGERPGPVLYLLCVQQKKRYAAEMIAVEVRDENDVHVVAIHAVFFHRNERRSSAVYEETRFR